MTIYAFTDGASRGNPGESGIGFVLKDDQGNVMFKDSGYLGTATNNIAEYQALIACLRKVMTTPCRKLVVHSDSELMVRQMQGVYRVRDKVLQEHFRSVHQLLANAPFEFSIVHIERALNKEADALANVGIDSKRALQV
jgi:ribonuclease HI